MTFKLGQKYFFILAVCAFLWNQQASPIAQKIVIENSYQQKVFAAVSSLMGEEKFLVIVNIEFSTIGGTLKKTTAPQSGTNTQGTYIPGLPTVPSSRDRIALYGSDSKKSSDSGLEVGRVDVIVGMNETSLAGNASIKQEIKSLVETIIPQTKDCDDCIKFKSMQFQVGQKNKRLAELETKIEELVAAKRKADLAADSIRLNNLENQLTDATKARTALESMVRLRELKQMEEDSIQFAQLVASERARKQQDSIRFVNTEERLERVMESKIKTDSVIIREAMGIMKQQAGGGNDEESLLGMQVGGGSSSIMSYVLIIILIISLMVVTFLAANNRKPKTIYLKPKESGKENKNKADKKESVGSKDEKPESDQKSEDDEVAAEVPAAPPSPPRPDEDAMRSELKSLRQTAVSLTVGEKEGASTLIKEWLEDNPNKEENAEEAGEE